MKKYVLAISTMFLFLGGFTQISYAEATITEENDNVNHPHMVRRPLTPSEMIDFQDIMSLAFDTAYDADYQYLYEAVYPAKTQKIRSLLSQAQQSFQTYEQTGNLNDLEHSAIFLYDTLDEMYLGYTAYRIVFNDRAYATRFGSLQVCINRILELESII